MKKKQTVFVFFGFSRNPQYDKELQNVIPFLKYKLSEEKENIMVILSGGAMTPSGLKEAEELRDFFKEKKVYFPAVMEIYSIDAYSNIRNSLEIIKRKGLLDSKEDSLEILFVGEAARKKETLELASRYIKKNAKKKVEIDYLPLYLLPEKQRKRREKLGRLLTIPVVGVFMRVLWYLFRRLKLFMKNFLLVVF